MSKRKYDVSFSEEDVSVIKVATKDGNKHSLDSDEEDSGAEEEKKNVMHADDIEGEEDGIAEIEGEITITPFNMKEELEEGHFDTQGHYHWKKEKEIKDGWLDNIDWVKVKGRPKDKYKLHKDDSMKGLGDESSSDSETEEEKNFNLIDTYRDMLQFMQPKETVTKSLQRLGGKTAKISSSERWKRKKAGLVDDGAEKVTKLTELANVILTKTGNMDVYQETYEKIYSIINKDAKKLSSGNVKKEEKELDMYSDDFDTKEKALIGEPMAETSTSSGIKIEENAKNEDKDVTQELMWEFKWSQDGGSKIHGPHTTLEMLRWATDGYFKTGVWVRKCGQDGSFYTSNRIDFDLYL